MANEPTGDADPGASGTAGTGRRPFLLDEADTPGAPRDSDTVSILAALSSTMQMPAVQIPADRATSWKPWLLAGGVAIVIGALGFGYATSQRPADSPPALAVAEESPTRPAAASTVEATAALPAVAAASPPLAGEPTMARVEDLPSATPPAAVPPADAPTAPDESASAAGPRGSGTSKPPSKAATRVAAAESPRRKDRLDDVRDAPAGRHATTEKAPRDVKLAPVETRSVAPARHDAAAVVSSQADSDVDLMAALLDHMAKTKPAGGANETAGRSASTATRPMTISALVDSCKSAGSKSAITECRRQICKGYWGKAQACPAQLAPGAAARKKSDD